MHHRRTATACWWAHRNISPTNWKNGCSKTPPTGSTSFVTTILGRSTISAIWWFRNCNGAAASEHNTRGQRYEIVLASRYRAIVTRRERTTLSILVLGPTHRSLACWTKRRSYPARRAHADVGRFPDRAGSIRRTHPTSDAKQAADPGGVLNLAARARRPPDIAAVSDR